MMSCEAVAVAQRTTVVGAALGLTVYLAAAVGGGGLAAGGGNGPGGGAVTTPSADRHAGGYTSNGGGAELRALTRSAVEAILEVPTLQLTTILTCVAVTASHYCS